MVNLFLVSCFIQVDKLNFVVVCIRNRVQNEHRWMNCENLPAINISINISAFSCSHYDFVPLILYSTYVSPHLALEKRHPR